MGSPLLNSENKPGKKAGGEKKKRNGNADKGSHKILQPATTEEPHPGF